MINGLNAREFRTVEMNVKRTLVETLDFRGRPMRFYPVIYGKKEGMSAGRFEHHWPWHALRDMSLFGEGFTPATMPEFIPIYDLALREKQNPLFSRLLMDVSSRILVTDSYLLVAPKRLKAFVIDRISDGEIYNLYSRSDWEKGKHYNEQLDDFEREASRFENDIAISPDNRIRIVNLDSPKINWGNQGVEEYASNPFIIAITGGQEEAKAFEIMSRLPIPPNLKPHYLHHPNCYDKYTDIWKKEGKLGNETYEVKDGGRICVYPEYNFNFGSSEQGCALAVSRQF